MSRFIFPIIIMISLVTACTTSHREPVASSQVPVAAPIAIHQLTHFNTAAVDPKENEILNALVAQLKSTPSLALVLEGHCDERGSDAYNLELGDRRARQVKAYLMEKGIAADRLLIVSKGESEPLSPRHSQSAWKENRRVEIKSVP